MFSIDQSIIYPTLASLLGKLFCVFNNMDSNNKVG